MVPLTPTCSVNHDSTARLLSTQSCWFRLLYLWGTVAVYMLIFIAIWRRLRNADVAFYRCPLRGYWNFLRRASRVLGVCRNLGFTIIAIVHTGFVLSICFSTVFSVESAGHFCLGTQCYYVFEVGIFSFEPFCCQL